MGSSGILNQSLSIKHQKACFDFREHCILKYQQHLAVGIRTKLLTRRFPRTVKPIERVVKLVPHTDTIPLP